MHNYMKIKGLKSGKITSLHNSEKCNQLTCVISVISESKPHAKHESHLHTTEVITEVIPSFHGLR